MVTMKNIHCFLFNDLCFYGKCLFCFLGDDVCFCGKSVLFPRLQMMCVYM